MIYHRVNKYSSSASCDGPNTDWWILVKIFLNNMMRIRGWGRTILITSSKLLYSFIILIPSSLLNSSSPLTSSPWVIKLFFLGGRYKMLSSCESWQYEVLSKAIISGMLKHFISTVSRPVWQSGIKVSANIRNLEIWHFWGPDNLIQGTWIW